MDSEVDQEEYVNADDFIEIANKKFSHCLAVCIYINQSDPKHNFITRPLLGDILSHCTQLVEFLDACGARNNQTWYYMRHLMTAGKLFATVGYGLLHIQHSLGIYDLLLDLDKITKDTDSTVNFNNNVILNFASEVVREAKEIGLTLPSKYLEENSFAEMLPHFKLKQDKISQKICSSEETIARVSTTFLNLAAEAEPLHNIKKSNPDLYYTYFPSPLSEQMLRVLEHKFHSLQSMYDTYIANTYTEHEDDKLCYLRGHSSIIYHLLENATMYCHYFERHLFIRQSEDFNHPLVDPDELLVIVVEYFLNYVSEYLKDAVQLSQHMLRKYAEKGSITVSVPKYRGFHVRPSTLVAKICLHYGSEVKMILGEEEYDASAPLDLFRANEYINAVKRRMLAAHVAEMHLAAPDAADSLTDAVKSFVHQLAYEQKIVIYENPLPIREFNAIELDEDLFAQLVLTEITRLLAMGKLDIESELKITFTGDVRVLHDLETLVNNGYGEDEFGNNIPLPVELSYLKR